MEDSTGLHTFTRSHPLPNTNTYSRLVINVRAGLMPVALLLPALLIAVLTGVAVSAQTSRRREAEVASAIHGAYARYVSAARRRDAQALTALYDEAAMLIPPGRDPIVGHDGILTEYRAFTASAGSLADETFTSVDLKVMGSYAVDVSMFAGHWNVPGKGPRPFKGKNMVVWKQERDGSWKLFRDMWDEYPSGK
jgi:ketosteroid isomerase-like protein